MSSLPPGVTDSMCEPYDPSCGNCGCEFTSHYYEDGEEPFSMLETCSRYSYAEGIEYDAKGQIVHACDSLIGECQCTCEGFVEGEYVNDHDDYHGDLD